ncbi:MAG: hypothetical protein ABEJ31_15835 [Haloarculaceae archaeon]
MGERDAYEPIDPQSLHPTGPIGRALRWVLVDGRRSQLAMLLTVGTFFLTVACIAAGLVPVRDAQLTQNVLSRFASSNLPFITIVVAVNQIVLSMDFGPLNQLRTQMDSMESFRDDVAAVTGVELTPGTPSGFLEFLTADIVDRTSALAEETSDDALAAVAAVVASETTVVSEALAESDVNTFETGSVLLEYQPGRHKLALKQAVLDSDGAVTDRDRDAVADLTVLLERTGVARQYFKTLHTKHELESLSRVILFAGVPAVVGGAFVSLGYGEVLALSSGRVVPALVLAGGLTVILLPFLFVVAYVLRVAAIARLTADFGPFVTS